MVQQRILQSVPGRGQRPGAKRKGVASKEGRVLEAAEGWGEGAKGQDGAGRPGLGAQLGFWPVEMGWEGCKGTSCLFSLQPGGDVQGCRGGGERSGNIQLPFN